MKRKQIIKGIKKKIKYFKKLLKETEKDLKRARTLPDDPSIGQDLSEYFEFSNGMLNENPHLKTDYLENYNHTIGYCNGSILELKNFLYELTVSKKQRKKDLKKEKQISKANKKTFKELNKCIKGKCKDKCDFDFSEYENQESR